MNPEDSLQDVVRCHLCETHMPPLYCDICRTYVCKACIGEHLSDESKNHSLLPAKQWQTIPKCQNHHIKTCGIYCENCQIAICLLCILSDEHEHHKKVDITEGSENIREICLRDLQELENIIHPTYQEIKTTIQVQKADLNENYQKLITSLNTHTRDLHKEIDTFMNDLKANYKDMQSKVLAALDEQEYEVLFRIFEITEKIAELNILRSSNNKGRVSEYKPRNAEFRKLPPKITVSLPNFSPQMINIKNIYQQFGSLSAFSFKTEENGYQMKTSDEPDKPQIISRIIPECGETYRLRKVSSCLIDDKIWTYGIDNIMRLYNIHGKLEKSVKTKSEKRPFDIALIRSDDLVYTDYCDGTINVVKNSRILELVKLRGWSPHGVCSTLSGELLVIMISDDYKETKVVRYEGSTEKQVIQFKDKGEPLYSSDRSIKYITENKNLDICVADCGVNAVVVVNQAGTFRFSYTSTLKCPFKPYGITTDSQSQILIADGNTNFIHILNKDGIFLRYIDNCDLQTPWGICVDTDGNLLVAEVDTGIVKKIRY